MKKDGFNCIQENVKGFKDSEIGKNESMFEMPSVMMMFWNEWGDCNDYMKDGELSKGCLRVR